MKKLSSFLVGLALTAGTVLAADTNTATSVNIVGFNNITCPKGKYVLVTKSFQSINGSVLHSADVFGTTLPNGSAIYYYDAAAVPPKYVIDNYTDLDGWDTNVVYKGGMGFWIYVDPSAPNASYQVTFSGEVPLSDTMTNVVRNGYNMLGFPYTSSVLWTNTALAKHAVNADVLYTYDPISGFGINNYTDLDGWDKPNQVLTMDMGFWFVTGNAAFTNIEVRPYSK